MSRRLAIIAGAGALAPAVARAALATGDAVQIVALADIDAPEGAVAIRATLAEPQLVIGAVRQFGASHLVLAGAVSLDDAARVRLAGALGSADGAGRGDAALSGLAGQLEKLTGAKLIGAHEVVGSLLAPEDLIAGPDLSPETTATARLALEAARAIGRLDLGQAAVAQGRRILAAEDAAGTDELIARIAAYRQRGLIADTAPLVLAKACKPDQPLQIDLPAIGPTTVANAAAAGIAVIAVEAGRTLVLDRADLNQAAATARVTVIGLSTNG